MTARTTSLDAAAGPGWTLSGRLPQRVAASCLYDSAGWLGTWETMSIERRVRHGYVCAEPAGGGGPSVDGVEGREAGDDGGTGVDVLPLYVVTQSPFWHGYELQVGLTGRFGNPVIFAGSTYSMYSKRGSIPAELVSGAHATAMAWIAAGEADVLVVPNLTGEGVASWLAAVGPPVGKVLLERTYTCELPGGGVPELIERLPSKLARDVRRRLRRADERGLRVRMIDGSQAHHLVAAALPLTVDTSDKNEWPALYDEAALHAMLHVPGAMMAAAEVDGRLVGAFFAFRRGDEITFMCGGVHYTSLNELSTYVSLMYRCTEWAFRHGVRRIEWGRDNYRFKEKHRLAGTDLWALVYAPGARPELTEALAGMHDVLSAYIEAA